MAISVKEVFYQSLQDFWAKKVRTLVTVLGVVLGTASIIIVMSLVQGTTKQTLEWLEENGGFTKVSFYRNWEFDKPTKRHKAFKYKELTEIVSLVDGIDTIDISSQSWLNTKYKKSEYSGPIVGITLDYFILNKRVAQEGRLINEYDVNHNQKVAVIGSTVRKELFGSVNPIGQFIDFENNKFKIIGILDTKTFVGKGDMGESNWMEWENKKVLIPLTTMVKLAPNRDKIREFSILCTDETMTPYVQKRLIGMVNSKFDNKPVWRADSNLDQKEAMAENSSKFNIIFYFISGISLVVGGIVIMNIMLATIKEKTREIGVRMSVGGSRFDIFLQFLIQTILVTTFGGIIGIIFGTSLVNFVGNYLQASVAITTQLIMISLAMSSGVGMIFGIIPSWKACSLDPVKALRTE